MIRPRIAEDIADRCVFLRPLDKILRDELRTQRIPRQQDALGDLALFGSNMQ